jgi:hypothetical protein
VTGKFHLDASGLTPLSDRQNEVAQGLGQLLNSGAPQAGDVAKSFGNIAFGLKASAEALEAQGGGGAGSAGASASCRLTGTRTRHQCSERPRLA